MSNPNLDSQNDLFAQTPSKKMRFDDGGNIDATENKKKEENGKVENGKEEKKGKLNKPKKVQEVFSKREIFMFLAFTGIMIYIITDGLKISEQVFIFHWHRQIYLLNRSYMMNNFLEETLGKNFTDSQTISKALTTSYIFYELLGEYYLVNQYSEFNLQSEVRYVSYLRFLQKRVEYQNLTLLNQTVKYWQNPITFSKKSFGVSDVFKQLKELQLYHNLFLLSRFNEENDGFVYFISPFNQTLRSAEILYYNQIEKKGFFDVQSESLQIDSVFYCPNIDITSIFQVTFKYNPTGNTDIILNMESFRLSPYSQPEDKVRLTVELIFLLLFVFYAVDEILKIFRQIAKEQKLYDEKELYKEELKKQLSVLRPQAYKSKKTAMKNAMNQLQKFSRLTNILKGLKNHVSDVWSFLDVAMLVFAGISISYWIRFLNQGQSLQDIFSQVDTSDQNSASPKTDLQSVNQKSVDINNLLTTYKLFASLTVYIASFKSIKYIASFSKRLQQYLEIMSEILNFVIFYIALISCIILAFAYLGVFVYGFRFEEYSTLFRSIVQTLLMMLSALSVSQDMLDFNPLGTFFYFVVFYFLMISILINLFWVFTKNGFVNFEREREKDEKNSSENVTSRKKIEYHFYYLFLQQIPLFWVRITNFSNRERYEEYLHDKKIEDKRKYREFEYSQNQVSYDLNFADVLEEGRSGTNIFLIEEDRIKNQSKQKLETVRIIWQTIALIAYLVINILFLIFLFYPINSHHTNKIFHTNIFNSNSTVTFPDGGSATYNFENIYRKDQIFNWLTNRLPEQFQYLNLQEFQKEILDGVKFVKGETALEGYVVEFYNLLMSNKVRLTLKYSELQNNPYSFPNLQTQNLGNMVYSDQDSILLDIDLSSINIGVKSTSSHDGYKGKVGYSFGVSPAEFTDLMVSLKRMNMLNRQLTSLIVDYALFNPSGPEKGIMYNVLVFEFFETGVIKTKIVHSESLTLMNGSLLYFELFLLACLVLQFIVNLVSVIRNAKGKYASYQRWYELYIVNYLSPSQLYFREKKRPELLRKLSYVFTISIILQIFYTFLLFYMIAVFFYYYIGSHYIICNGEVFNVSTYDFFTFMFKNTKDWTFFEYLNQHEILIESLGITQPIATLIIIVPCLQILYNLTTNQSFQDIFTVIKYAFSQLPYLLLLLYLFLSSFVLLTYIKLGSTILEFSTPSQAYQTMLEFFYQFIYQIQIFRGDDSWFEVIFFLIPYSIIIRFLIINLFISVVYYGYEKMAQERSQSKIISYPHITQKFNFIQGNKEKDGSSIDFMDFILKTITLVKETREGRSNKNTEFILQIVKKSSMFDVFENIKNSVRQYKPQQQIIYSFLFYYLLFLILRMDPQIWSERSAFDLKKEFDNRNQLKQICDEISSQYMMQLNQGNLSFIQDLSKVEFIPILYLSNYYYSKDLNRKLIEFQLRLKYYTYFRLGLLSYKQIEQQFDAQLNFFKSKFTTNFSQQSEEEVQEHYLKLYICELESKLKERLQIINEINTDIDAAQKSQGIGFENIE